MRVESEAKEGLGSPASGGLTYAGRSVQLSVSLPPTFSARTARISEATATLVQARSRKYVDVAEGTTLST